MQHAAGGSWQVAGDTLARTLLFLVKWKINFQTISFVDGFDFPVAFLGAARPRVSPWLLFRSFYITFIYFALFDERRRAEQLRLQATPTLPAYKWQINSLVAQISCMQLNARTDSRTMAESQGWSGVRSLHSVRPRSSVWAKGHKSAFNFN